MVHLLFLRLLFKFRLIADIRENISGMYLTGHKLNWTRKLIAKAIFPFWTYLTLKFADATCCSSKMLAESITGNETVFSKKVLIAPNYPTMTYYRRARMHASNDRHPKKTIFFSGHIKKNRGLQYLVAALKCLPTQVLMELRVLIVGDGDARSELEIALRKIRGLEVTFTGMLRPEEVIALGCDAHIGFMGYLKTPNSELTLPGKVFEYFACGLQVVSTPRRSLETLSLPNYMISYYDTPEGLAVMIQEMLRDDRVSMCEEVMDYAMKNLSQKQNLMKYKLALGQSSEADD